ncbi:hypothetical protein CT690_15895 [Serratia plymuthica]|uniref:Uncharacterized protein n=2 Tax=Serratia plymuthica TaxID=82996 RepID=A0A318NZN7_SERPL|nr:hypothetical protein CT690_15895 [Serratia plymuthica]
MAEREQMFLEGGDSSNNEHLLAEMKAVVGNLATAIDGLDNKSRQLDHQLKEQRLTMREVYASKAYRFVWLWSIALIIIIFLQGSKSPLIDFGFIKFKPDSFELDPKVIIALISGVTVNIVAVFVVVIRNLFPSDSKDDKPEKVETKKE